MNRIEENCTHINNKLLTAIDEIKALPLTAPTRAALLTIIEVLIIEAQTIFELAKER